MSRAKGSGRGLQLVGIKVEVDLWEALGRYAQERQITTSEAGRRLLRVALKELPPQDPGEAGYQDGLRRGLQEARTAIREALAELW